MKHKLLSVIALMGAAFLSTSAMAQDWTEPVRPERPVAPSWTGATVAPESGGQYYILNTEAGMFLGAGMDWGTRAVVTLDSLISTQDNIDLKTNVSFILPFQLDEAEGGWNIAHMGTSKVGATDNPFHLVHEGNGAWCDGWDSRFASDGLWVLTPVEGKTNVYRMTSDYAEENIFFGVDANNYASANTVYTWTDLNIAGESSTVAPWVEWAFVPISEAENIKAYAETVRAHNNDEAFNNAMAIYNARVALYNAYTKALEDAEIAEVNIDQDVAEAAAIYNNSAATVQDLEAAKNSLNAAVNAAIFAGQFNGTPDDPQEVTGICLVNANFDQGNINGWTNTFSGKATNIGYQGASYTNNGTTLTAAGSATDDDGSPAYLSKFIEAWKDNNDPWKIGDAELSQTVYGLPSGMYKLSCDVIAVHQWGKFENPATGVKLFIAPDTGNEVFQEVATNNNNPEHFSITFVCPEGVKALTFGLKTESTTANWIAADNFRIYYYGKTEELPEMLILKDMVKQAQDSEISDADNANKEVLAAFMTALEEAQDVAANAGATAEECTAASDKLKAALAAAQQSIKDYVKLRNYIDEANELSSKAYDAGFEAASGAVDELNDEWSAAYEEGTATAEMIDTLAGVAYNTMMDNLAGEIKPGTDLTFLLANPGFTTGTTANPTGWKINSGSMTELRAATHNIETYHKAFDLSQTLKSMPAGVYDVTLQGFARHDNASDTEGTWLYGGITKDYLIDLDNDVEQKVTEENRKYIDGMTQLGDGNYDNSRGISTDEEGNTLYQCNGMTGAYYWFQETNPNTGELYYTNHVKVILDKEGDLTIGIHCESTNDWVIFDNFALKYIGQDVSVYEEQLNKKLEEFEAVTTADNAFLTAKATEMAETLPARSQKAIDDADGDAIMAMISEVTEAIDYVKKGNELGEELASSVEFYYDQIGKLEALVPTMEEYDQLLETWIDPYSMAEELADNDALQALIDKIDADWIPYLMSGAVDASKDAPIDVTAVIYNPTYVDPKTAANSANGWSSFNEDGTTTTPGLSYNEAEFYDKNFNHYQTIKGLLPGYYTVTVDAYYRAGFPEPAAAAFVADTMAYNATMYAIGVDSMSVAVKDIFAGAQETAIAASDEVTVELGQDITRYIPNMMVSAETYLNFDGSYTNTLNVEVGEDGVLTIGLSKYAHISGDWTIFSNWTLSYLGAGPENAPDAVQRIDAANTGIQSIYNLAGQKVQKAQKGIYIINGKKVVVK
ncbi:MAG: hypothetical protein IKO12_05595 [Bacteroidaceae bacterium]|nr:hypothetical protein [Bacteroidaceae bacterium]